MSRETIEWLNTNTLIGFTDKRGNAWHYRAEDQGTETNHYVGPVPVEDVRRRLFNWTAESRPVMVALPASVDTADGIDADGNPVKYHIIEGKTANVRSDNGHVMGIFGDGYQRHQHQDVLLDTLSIILDDGLYIGSAGLLKGGAVAWVSVEVQDNITTPEGVEFRPNLLAVGSHDGSHATTYKRVIQNVVCDNTMSAGLSEVGQEKKIRHSKYSNLRIAEARDALAIVHTIGEDFAAEVKALTSVEVSGKQWNQFLAEIAPITDDTKGRSLTMAERKREDLTRLWKSDMRVAPWTGTAWGVLQAVNTYTHHEGIVRGAGRAERNMLRAVSGGVDVLDTDTMVMLNRVLVG